MNFTLAELTLIKLEPGDVLAVKLYGDDYDQESVASLQDHMRQTFPNNKVMMFVLPNGNDLQMEKINANLENKENSQLNDLVDGLNKDCSKPTSYCNDCACGKKEIIESQNK